MTTHPQVRPEAPASPTETPWHALSREEALERAGVSAQQGLSAGESAARQERHGPNRLREQPPRPLWKTFLDQFKSLLILILFGAAVLAWAIGELRDAAVILVVTMVNAFLGFFQEMRAEQSLQALKKMLALMAYVRRDGEAREVPSESLVPGDIVLLEAGSRVPADGRLVVSESLEVDESALTGESEPVAKQAREAVAADAPVAERTNTVFMNTMVTRGRAEVLVTATGMGTEMGQLAEALTTGSEPPTPLQVQLDKLGKRLALVAALFIAVIFTLAMASGRALVEAILESIALAVAAIPEGLPAVVTVTLALGMQRMARNRAIVKRLAAVETLGCTTVICSDKTGTLTLNQMTVRAFTLRGLQYHVTGEGYRPEGRIEPPAGAAPADYGELLRPLLLCNDSRVAEGQVLGDPMEGALDVLGQKAGLRRDALEQAAPRVAEIPFDTGHKFMATFHREDDSIHVYVKGAPEAVEALSTRVLGPEGEQPLDDAARERLGRENAALAEQQLRVLAAASRTLPAGEFDPEGDLWACARDMTLVGLVGLIDPPRAEARTAIDRCRSAGIDVKMITGDQRGTAAAIGRALGLEGRVLSGAELDGMDAGVRAEAIPQASVFARVTPAHKVQIVEALKARDHVVAMTGDGVNDAPALRIAHIGVAMGHGGTEVAKESATMVLTDDNFATIVGAVREGRTIYANIVKFVRFQLSTNIGALFSMLVAQLAALPAPFNPIQILWVNIIMDGPPAMAMGLEPSRAAAMEEPPRSPDEEILSWGRLRTLLLFGAIMVAGTLGMLAYGLSTGSEARALTLAFHTFVLFQMFNAFNARVERGTAFNRRFFSNPTLWLSLAGVLTLQALAVQWGPAQGVFHTTGLDLADWALCAAVAASILAYGEVHRAVAGLWRRRASPVGLRPAGGG